MLKSASNSIGLNHQFQEVEALLKMALSQNNSQRYLLKLMTDNIDKFNDHADLFDILLEQNNCDSSLLIDIAANPKLSIKLLENLVAHNKCGYQELKCIIKSSEPPFVALKKILQYSECESDILYDVANSTKIKDHPELIEDILEHNHFASWVLYDLVSTEETSLEVLEKICRHVKCDYNLLSLIAERSNLPIQIRNVILASDKCNSYILFSLANNADIELLESLTTHVHCNDKVLFAIANNLNSSSQLLEGLIVHNHVNDKVLFAIATNPNSSSQLLENLIEHECFSISVLSAIASNPNSSAELLETLATDPRCDVTGLLSIVGNKKSSSKLLGKILNHEKFNRDVAFLMAHHQNILSDKDLINKFIEKNPQRCNYLLIINNIKKRYHEICQAIIKSIRIWNHIIDHTNSNLIKDNGSELMQLLMTGNFEAEEPLAHLKRDSKILYLKNIKGVVTIKEIEFYELYQDINSFFQKSKPILLKTNKQEITPKKETPKQKIIFKEEIPKQKEIIINRRKNPITTKKNNNKKSF